MSIRAYEEVIRGEAPLAVVGLGYVGLPIALAFAARMPVIGFDIREENIDLLRTGRDPSQEMPAEAFAGKNITFTSDPATLKAARVYIIAVPTPIDKTNNPDLSALLGASRIVGEALSEGDLVVYESTVYP
ncbi:MAG TPA: nucleotide sugar dehydrogenase, partial [Bacteroidales bacterium]|nr:nucleotide sugar dehydrogenase [Bacteroidales bacterium]